MADSVLKELYPYFRDMIGGENAKSAKEAYKLLRTYGMGAALRGHPTTQEAEEAYMERAMSGERTGDLPLEGEKGYDPYKGLPNTTTIAKGEASTQTAEAPPAPPMRKPADLTKMRRPEAVAMALPEKQEVDAAYGLTQEEAEEMLHSFADSSEGRAVAAAVRTEGKAPEARKAYEKFLEKQVTGFRPEGY